MNLAKFQGKYLILLEKCLKCFQLFHTRYISVPFGGIFYGTDDE